MTRIGKIARLPHELREQLNRRLQDGEPGAELVGWLNDQPEVKSVLAEHFAGRPITEQNLSEWKTGGYGDWLAHQQALEALGRMQGEVWELEMALNEDRSVTGLLVQWLAARCLAAARAWAQKDPTDPEAMRQLRGLCREAVRLRRADLQGQRVELEEEQYWHERERELNELKLKRKREIEGAMRLYVMGLGPKPREWVEEEKAEGERRKAEGNGGEAKAEGKRGVVPSPSPRPSPPMGARGNAGGVRANPTKSDRAGNGEGRMASGERGSEGGSQGESRPVSDHQPSTPPPSTKSEAIRPNPTSERKAEG